MKRVILTILFIFCVLYVFFGGALYFFQRNLIYHPDSKDFSSCPGFSDSEKIDADGTRAYFKRNSDHLIVFYHGNAGSACARSFLRDRFEEWGLSYVFVEYAGYSADIRSPSQALLMRDVEHIDRFVASEGFSKVTVIGESLGASLATYHASIAAVDSLLLLSPFYSMTEKASRDFGMYPMSILLTETYDSASWIRDSLAGRLEIVHGSADDTIPIGQARKLFGEAGMGEKRFVEVVGAGHNDMYGFPETLDAVRKFIGE
jgi:pimeloyl-ACP methyl ester carboxylesterase